MTDQQQPRTAAQEIWEKAKDQYPLHWTATVSMQRSEEVATDLGAQIAALRDTVAAQADELKRLAMHFSTMDEKVTDYYYEADKRFAALESPASAPECTCTGDQPWHESGCALYEASAPEPLLNVLLNAPGWHKDELPAPEPDPLCRCGHPKMQHFALSGACFNVLHEFKAETASGHVTCGCIEYVPAQAEPATAHQEPDPLCQNCGHPLSIHEGRCSFYLTCLCEQFVPVQPSPATAHQEPPDKVLLAIRDLYLLVTTEPKTGLTLDSLSSELRHRWRKITKLGVREYEVDVAIRAYGRDSAR